MQRSLSTFLGNNRSFSHLPLCRWDFLLRFEENSDIMKISTERLRVILPQLKDFFGFRLCEINGELLNVHERQIREELYNNELASQYSYTSRGHTYLKVADYILATDDTISIQVTKGFKKRADDIVKLCKETVKDDYNEVASILIFMAAILNRDLNGLVAECETDEYDWNKNNYNKYIRPDLLRLYIARNGRKGRFHPYCTIQLGYTSNAIQIQSDFPWFEKMLDRYLHRFLGVSSIEEAETELRTVYGKKVGNPLNERVATYIWGTFHLMQTLTSLVSKDSKKCSRPQSRFIAEYLNIIGLIDIYETDSEAVRSRLNNYLKKYDTLDELLDKQEYKTSPNNTSSMELY